MRNSLLLLVMLLCPLAAVTATAQVSVSIGLPNLSIGINLPLYPELVPVPGYPVYYAPGMDSNYFFYDGMYWVYERDNWYASSWYNGPWGEVSRDTVPVFVLRIPVRYYRQPPAAFRGWRQDAPPHWGERWGDDWAKQRSGWDHWKHSANPARPPLPVYQRQYSGDRYPHVEQQQALQTKNYRYQARDPLVRQQRDAQRAPNPAAPAQPKPRSEVPVKNAGDRQGARPDSSPVQNTPATPRAATPPKEAPQPRREAAPQPQSESRQKNTEQPIQGNRAAPVAQPKVNPQPQQRAPQARQPDRGEQAERPQERQQGRAQEPQREQQQQERARDKPEDRPDERGQNGRR